MTRGNLNEIENLMTNTKAELVQVNHTPIICLRNFINKKSKIEKTNRFSTP